MARLLSVPVFVIRAVELIQHNADLPTQMDDQDEAKSAFQHIPLHPNTHSPVQNGHFSDVVHLRTYIHEKLVGWQHGLIIS